MRTGAMSLLIALVAGAAALAQQDAPGQRPDAPQLVQLGRVALAAGQHERLCFTPDGSHLALAGLRSTRVVDATGAECARCDGTMLVQPGPAPGELWLLTEHNMRRWSAATRAFVGEPVTWPGRHLRLTTHERDAGTRTRVVTVRDGEPWTDDAARMPDGSFRALAFGRAPANHFEEIAAPLPPHHEVRWLNGGAEDSPALLLVSTQFLKAAPTGSLYAFDASGERSGARHFADDAALAARSRDGASVAVLLANGSVHLLTAVGLSELAPPVAVGAAAITWTANGEWLAATSDSLLRLHPRTLATVGRFAWPAGLGRVRAIVRNADGTRLALADGHEVFVLRVD
jgi:hypothetical protein